MKNEKTQSEWYELANQAADTIFAKQQELFNDLTDTVYYATEVTRFDSFVKINATVIAKDYQPTNEMALKVSEYLNLFIESINLSSYTNDEDFDEYVKTTLRKMETYAEAVKNIINN